MSILVVFVVVVGSRRMSLQNAKLTIAILLIPTLLIVLAFTTAIPSKGRFQDEYRREEKKELNVLHVVVVVMVSGNFVRADWQGKNSNLWAVINDREGPVIWQLLTFSQ